MYLLNKYAECLLENEVVDEKVMLARKRVRIAVRRFVEANKRDWKEGKWMVKTRTLRDEAVERVREFDGLRDPDEWVFFSG